jgi:hypothetical protein
MQFFSLTNADRLNCHSGNLKRLGLHGLQILSNAFTLPSCTTTLSACSFLKMDLALRRECF